jgi:hypothetical protein
MTSGIDIGPPEKRILEAGFAFTAATTFNGL